MSNDFKFYESMIMMMHNNPTEKVNAEYLEDIKAYLKSPVDACDKKSSLRLLKGFARKDFPVFWSESVNIYLPAVSEGTMKLAEKVYPHDEAICYAKKLIEALDEKELARAFLYGVAHHAPEYRTALACYYFIKNLPEHTFEKKYIGTTFAGDVYSENICEICNYNAKLSDEPKMQFWHINVHMAHFYDKATVPFHFDLNTAIVFLEEFKTLPTPAYSQTDLQYFQKIIEFIEALPDATTPSKLRKELKASGFIKMTVDQTEAFIDMLGYLNILHTNDSFGVTVCHTKERDMLDPTSSRSYFAHPVNRWTRKNGIDYSVIDRLFGDLYEVKGLTERPSL